MKKFSFVFYLSAITCMTYASVALASPASLYSDLSSRSAETAVTAKKIKGAETDSGFLKAPSAVSPVTVNTWSVYKGQTLNNVLAQWANIAGWDLVWDSGQTYKLRAAASFGNIAFEQAVQELFDAVGNTDPRLYVTLYEKNKVILVSTKPGF